MSLEPSEIIETAEKAPESKSKLNVYVAISVALIATFMGICKVKDDNIVQAMQKVQAGSIDKWSYYQARNTQLKVATATAEQFHVSALMTTGQAKAYAEDREKFYRGEVVRLSEEKAKVKGEAEANDKEYDKLNYRDDQFDLSDAALAVSISLLAMASLTQQLGLFFLALVPETFGFIMGMAGLCGWHIHPDFITNLLGFLS
jgi:hypothetical protein